MKISPRPVRKTNQLTKARVSVPHGRYFVTCCAVRPTNALTTPEVAEKILSAWHELESCHDIQLMTGTIMPDHVHMLFKLGDRLGIGQVIGKLKSITKPALLAGHTSWQSNYFEHRLRPDEGASAYARYIFLNPYRAGFISHRDGWPYWVKNDQCDFDFMTMLRDGRFPPEEWLKMEWEELGIDASSVGDD